MKRIAILGTRGIPARHGGFETFAEDLALYLTQKGWKVRVYCQTEGKKGREDWNGIELIHRSGIFSGALGTIIFDIRAAWSALFFGGISLVLGYNTGFLNLLLRLGRSIVITNMDGLEWARSKYGRWQAFWLRINERLALLSSHYVVADHPEIARRCEYLGVRENLRMLPYGARPIEDEGHRLDVDLPREYFLVVARPVPENHVLEIVRWYSDIPDLPPLLVVGPYDGDDQYTHSVRVAASEQVKFVGQVYDRRVLSTIRKRASCYIHGHSVGGTNPSLLEAMAAQAPIICHENPFNRWVLGSAGLYFYDQQTFADAVMALKNGRLSPAASAQMRQRFQAEFTLERSMRRYEKFLEEVLARPT